MARIPLRVKEALDREWSDLASMGQDRSSGSHLESQFAPSGFKIRGGPVPVRGLLPLVGDG